MASGRVLQTIVLLAQGAALSLAPSFAVVSQVVQNARFRFKDHILHLNPCLVLELLELLLGERRIAQWHFLVGLILPFFHLLSPRQWQGFGFFRCLLLLSHPLYNVLKSRVLNHSSS